MAIDLFTDNPSSRGISPRISFSHDLNTSDIIPIEPHIPLKSSLIDYDFDFDLNLRSSDHETSLADELFENGVILPVQIKRKNIPIITKSRSFSNSSVLPPLPPPSIVHNNGDSHEKQETNNNNNNSNNNKSFWKFKRSKSFNCGSIYTRGLCPLTLLSRSKSTGSTSAKRSLIPKDESHNNNHNNKQKSSSSFYQKPPLKKNYGGNSSFNSGVIQVSPVLNVPTGKVFGFGSIFSTGKDKSKKK